MDRKQPSGMCSAGDISDRGKAIREATEKSLKARDLYAEQIVFQLTESLSSAQGEVQKAILRYKTLGSLPENKLVAVTGLEKLNAEIADTLKTLRKNQTLLFRQAARASFRSGIYQGIEEFAAAWMPFYRDLTPGGIEKLTTSVFTLVDTNALDFMVNYNLILVGDIHREMESGIKRVLLSGITMGKGVEGIVRDLGKVIEDKESFRQAGSKVFTKAQYRMEMIARTEILRAHNQGRIKFHQQIGVRKLEWMAMEDERMCPVCGGYDGKQFDANRFPNIPAHPNCRCTCTVAWPLDICDGKPDVTSPKPSGCLLSPETINGQAKSRTEEERKLRQVFDSGEVGNLSSLTVRQLQTLSRQNGIAVARTKSDFMKLLDGAEPGVHHADLGGAVLQAKIRQFNLAALRSKDELTKLLSEKQKAIQQAKMLAEKAKNLPVSGGLHNLTMNQLKEMAKQQGVSLYLTKSEVVEMLDALEPKTDHSGLSGKTPLTVKKRYGIPSLKNKEQLAKALEKAAGAQMAGKWLRKQIIEEATKVYSDF